MSSEDKMRGYSGQHDGPAQLSRAYETMDREDSRSDARIQNQLGYMQEQLTQAQELVSILINKLDPILLPDMDRPMNAIPNEVPRKPSSELSNTIDDLNGQISRIQRRIGDAIERVQL